MIAEKAGSDPAPAIRERPCAWAAGDPVMVAALAIARPDTSADEWANRAGTGANVALTVLADGTRPGVMLTAGSIYVTWRRTSLGRVVYRCERNGRRWLELDCTLPLTVLNALVGRDLADVADLPGTRGMTIRSTGLTLLRNTRLDIAAAALRSDGRTEGTGD